MELVKPGAHPHYSEGLYCGMRGPHGSLAALLVICWAWMVFSSLVMLIMDSSWLWYIYWVALVFSFSFNILRLSVCLVISSHISI